MVVMARVSSQTPEATTRGAWPGRPHALPRVVGPDVLCVLANRDGIVPPAAARSVETILGADRVHVLEVGEDDAWYAHADLFIGDTCQQDVFEPMRAWLAARA